MSDIWLQLSCLDTHTSETSACGLDECVFKCMLNMWMGMCKSLNRASMHM